MVRSRIHGRTRAWRVVVENTFETKSSILVFGHRGNEPVVLKLLKRPGDEWRSGKFLEAFNGNGLVCAYEYVEGAVLLERLRPGYSLTGMVLDRRDEEATDILADVIERMSACEPSMESATVADWADGFERYSAMANDQIPRDLLEEGERLYRDLCASQRRQRLLHGDLHHYNVLFDSGRGWLAIDPKGVRGELEYEIGAALRNPIEQPDLFASRSTIERRLKQFTNRLNVDFARVLAWAFAQAVLSAIWEIEDGFSVDATSPFLRLADAIRPMLDAVKI